MYDKDENKVWITRAKLITAQTSIFGRGANSQNQPKRRISRLDPKNAPLIYLETVESSLMKKFIYLCYLVLVIALFVNIYEKMISTKNFYFDKDIKISNHNDNKELDNLDILWENRVKLNLKNRFFELFGILKYPPEPSKGLVIDFVVKLQTYIVKNGKAGFLRNFESTVRFEKTEKEYNNIVFMSEKNSPHGYYWEDRIFEYDNGFSNDVQMRIKIHLKKIFNPVNKTASIPITIALVLNKTNESYVVRSFIFNIVIMLITIVLLIVYSTYLQLADSVATEQKLVKLLFASLIIFQISLLFYYVPFNFKFFSLRNNRLLFKGLSELLQTFSCVILAIFILLIADLVNVSSSSNSITELVSSWKIILISLNLFTAVMTIIISLIWELSEQKKLPSHFVSTVYFSMYTVWLVTSTIWVLWVTTLFRSAHRELQYWNFNITRSTQFSFRFFATLSWFLVFYLALAYVSWYCSSERLFARDINPFLNIGSNIVFTFYTIFCAVCHFPIAREVGRPLEDGITESHTGFSLKDAKIMCELAWQAYGENPDKNVKNGGNRKIDLSEVGFTLYKVGNFDSLDIQWFIAEKKDTIAIAFRGSQSIVNVLADLKIYRTAVNNNFWYTGDPRFVNPTQGRDFSDCTMLHSGFMQSYMSVRKDVINCLIELLGKEVKNKIVLITGHSMGGSLATICALELRCRFGLNVRIYTFGSPRVGCKYFKKLFSAMIGKRMSFRIVFEGDFASGLPSDLGSYKHVESEVYIDRSGNLIFRPGMVEKFLLPGKNSLQQHNLINYVEAIDIASVQLGEDVSEDQDWSFINGASGI